jgi:hypothetical protein
MMKPETFKIGELDVQVIPAIEHGTERCKPHELSMQIARRGFVQSLTKSTEKPYLRVVVKNRTIATMNLAVNGAWIWNHSVANTPDSKQSLLERVVAYHLPLHYRCIR